MKKVFIFSLLLLISCSPKGYWLSEGRYRAKKSNYKLVTKKFVKSDLVSTKFIYLSQDSLVSKDKTLKSALGFTDKGRAFLNSINTLKIDLENKKTNTLEKAQEIGYYRVDGNKIIFERLTSSDFGQYISLEGEIKGDTIVFTYKNWPNKSKVFKFIKSNLPAN